MSSDQAALVPNHMGVMGADNRWWLDVLENGPTSIYASFFDVDWHPLKAELRDKVLLPILGQSYGDALENGQLTLQFDEANGSFSVWYFQHRLPVAPHEYCRLLRHRLPLLEGQLRPDHADLQEFTSLITAFSNLPAGDAGASGKSSPICRFIALTSVTAKQLRWIGAMWSGPLRSPKKGRKFRMSAFSISLAAYCCWMQQRTMMCPTMPRLPLLP